MSLSQPKNKKKSSFLFGSIAGAFSCFLLQPLDVLKTRIQSNSANKSIFYNTSRIIKYEGISSLWKGFGIF